MPSRAKARPPLFMLRWLDSWAGADSREDLPQKVDWIRVLPFIAMHLACFGVFFVGVSWFAVVFAFGFFVVRMFFITGFYHRYFSHRAYATGRVFQFVLAFLAQSSAQKSVLWWSAKHRHHHLHADTGEDVH